MSQSMDPKRRCRHRQRTPHVSEDSAWPFHDPTQTASGQCTILGLHKSQRAVVGHCGDTGHFTHSAVQLTYTAVRANPARTMDRVCDDHETLIITRNGERSVVMLSLEDYKALEETAYLLRAPANAKRLLSAVEQLTTAQVERKPVR